MIHNQSWGDDAVRFRMVYIDVWQEEKNSIWSY